ncbi:MAG TPA: recombinase RecA [Anaerohalosphaeraceae bacterium]|jgi:recombination protein RecA|nr:recombinase RecA [Phycisphaerae bacterium]HOM60211.1 recombinase RecA [Anaerohalosphaeraceae bacterium]HOT72034.1 recombinase RecA [Anaerohalosphaeraceae bacterium]HQG05476.1 recombinase RecA [Anaerohalosphaeraceae bacterium]HQI06849.1 recombinase RecA [Anaerohalosphaeraceae bacterium]
MAKKKTSEKKEASAGPEKPATKSDALDRAIAQIEKQYGAGSIMKMDDSSRCRIEGISTGALSLDLALGGSGVPRGRVIEFYGPESSGKTTLALHAIANAQKAGGVAAFIDAEHALDPTWARKLGVDISSLLISQPDTGEQALDIAEMLIKSNAVDIIVIDSVAALVPAAELQGEMGQSHVGLQARLMSQALRKLTGAISKSKTCLIFINQIRMKIGVMFGNPETTPGGNALKFYASVRVDIRRVETLKNSKGEAIGNRVRARVVKNKLAAPFKAAEFDILFDRGICAMGDLLDLAAECNVLTKSGAWYLYGDRKLGQGRDNAKLYLEQNPDFAEELKEKILAARGLAETQTE